MAIRHVVTFVWADGLGDEHVAQVTAGLAALPDLIPSIRAYEFGPDLGLNEGNSSYAVTALFDDEAGYLEYRDHPAHRQFIADHITGKITSRAAVQLAV
ncbi:MAG: Dabb family protein [Ilumatobacteraceae bacterium]|jgi:hypothetical protein|nr:Dabb family protein [Ilumatobacteraceae bacterium]